MLGLASGERTEAASSRRATGSHPVPDPIADAFSNPHATGAGRERA
jgi:hypothetical protein